MKGTQTKMPLQRESEQHIATNSIPESLLKCTALCPLFGYDASGRMICRLRTKRRYDDEIRTREGLPCIATPEDAELLERWVREIDEEKHIIVDLLEEITGKNHDSLRTKQFPPSYPVWTLKRRRY